MSVARARLVWIAIGCAAFIPIIAALRSPLLAWRDPIYIFGGFAGIAALALLLIQPLLMGGRLQGLTVAQARRLHRGVGISLVLAILLHVAALWVTSPPDMVDALLFVSPTPFSAWGVVAMWSLFAAALLVGLRRRLRWRWQRWRLFHVVLASVTVVGSVVHAVLIEGAMETISKVALCLLVLGALALTLKDLKTRSTRTR